MPEEEFLRALKSIDKRQATRSAVLRGALLIRSLCYKPARVFSTPERSADHSDVRSRSTGIELAGDKELLATLAGDLAEAISSQWHTFVQTDLWSLFANHSLDCIVLPTTPMDFGHPLDRALRSNCPTYVGAAQIDFGNPLQKELFANSLIKDAFIENGAVHMLLEYDGTFEGSFFGAEEFSPRGIVTMNEDEYRSLFPALGVPTELSARGLVSMMRIQNRLSLNVHERLAQVLSGKVERTASTDFEWDIRKLPNALEEVEVQSRKLTDYLLNSGHPKGRSKAVFFERVLDISSTDSKFLEVQFVDALREAQFVDVRLDDYGIRFGAELPIKGRNGRTATIETAWIVRPGERASLITAVPGKKDVSLELRAKEPELVPDDLKGTERWQAIFELATAAGKRAATECVPTPMKISGGELIMDGECGGGYVVVPDARKGFSRWLKTTGNGSPNDYSGMRVYADVKSQSADRAYAYAENYAKVLRRNGIEANATRYVT